MSKQVMRLRALYELVFCLYAGGLVAIRSGWSDHSRLNRFLEMPTLYLDRVVLDYRLSDAEPHLYYMAWLYLTLLLLIGVFLMNRSGRLRSVLCLVIPFAIVASPLYGFDARELFGGPQIDLWVVWVEMVSAACFTFLVFFRRSFRVLVIAAVFVVHFLFWSWATFGAETLVASMFSSGPYGLLMEVVLPAGALGLWALYLKQSRTPVLLPQTQT